jgi:hypothetical protein
MSDQGNSTGQIISLPKGGGAIRGIGEKFAANPVTGSGSMSVPIAASPGRSGFGPQLSLSYKSGAGNGPFGFGWSLSKPSITRKTDKGLSKYHDTAESDVFILSSAEDLVPVLGDDGKRWSKSRTIDGKTYRTIVIAPGLRLVRSRRTLDKRCRSQRHPLALDLRRQHSHALRQSRAVTHRRSRKTAVYLFLAHLRNPRRQRQCCSL